MQWSIVVPLPVEDEIRVGNLLCIMCRWLMLRICSICRPLGLVLELPQLRCWALRSPTTRQGWVSCVKMDWSSVGRSVEEFMLGGR